VPPKAAPGGDTMRVTSRAGGRDSVISRDIDPIPVCWSQRSSPPWSGWRTDCFTSFHQDGNAPKSRITAQTESGGWFSLMLLDATWFLGRNAPITAASPREAHATLRDLLAEPDHAASAVARAQALALFDVATVGDQWRDHLDAGVSNVERRLAGRVA